METALSNPISRMHDKARQFNNMAAETAIPRPGQAPGNFALYTLIANLYTIAAEVTTAIVTEIAREE